MVLIIRTIILIYAQTGGNNGGNVWKMDVDVRYCQCVTAVSWQCCRIKRLMPTEIVTKNIKTNNSGQFQCGYHYLNVKRAADLKLIQRLAYFVNATAATPSIQWRKSTNRDPCGIISLNERHESQTHHQIDTIVDELTPRLKEMKRTKFEQAFAVERSSWCW